MEWKKYSKFWVALAGAVVAGLVQYYGKDNTLVSSVVGVLTAAGVYQIKNQ